MAIMYGSILIQAVLGLTAAAGPASVATRTMSLGVRDGSCKGNTRGAVNPLSGDPSTPRPSPH